MRREEYLRANYIARINGVIDYIEANIDKNLSLAGLADVARFSPFHFHRIFRAMVGETLNDFIQRVRLEKAAAMLLQNHKDSITDIAFACGFSGSSTFARAFKQMFGMNASSWRNSGEANIRNNSIAESKESKTHRNIRKDFDVLPYYDDENKQMWRIEMKRDKQLISGIAVKDVMEMHIAYIRHIGPYAQDMALFRRLYDKLPRWAGPRGFLNIPETKFIAVYHDNPDITDPAKLRTDVCITVPQEAKPEGEIGRTALPAGKYAIAHFEINVNQYKDAWDAVYGGWLPESGYQPDDRPCFEVYLNDPTKHPKGMHIVDIYAPVKPL